MRRIASIALVLVVASLALVSTGCGGDDGTETSDPTEWANAFCTAVQTWGNEVQRIGSDITSSPTTETLQQAADDLGTATDEFVDELEGLGAPDTEGGDEVEAAIEEFTDTAETEKAELQEAVEDAEDTTGVAAALGVAGSSLQAMSGALQSMLQAFEDADTGQELETAFDEAEACGQIGE